MPGSDERTLTQVVSEQGRKVPREHRFYFFCGGEGRTDSKLISGVVLDALRVGGDWGFWRGLLQVMTIRRSPWWEIYLGD